MKIMRKIAIYGKGGIGKSTTVSNIAAALAERGMRVMQIGCDPKSDSTQGHTGGRRIPTVLDSLRECGDNVKLEDLVFQGSDGVLCVEAGGPTPGVGCAGRGIIAAFEKLEELHAFQVYQPDVVLFDVLGDVVCGGFALPIRGGYADEVFVVTSGEMMSMYAAGNIATAVENFRAKGYARFGGFILNAKGFQGETEKVEELAREYYTRIVATIPRDITVQRAEDLNKTVVEAFPDLPMADCYRRLAGLLVQEAV